MVKYILEGERSPAGRILFPGMVIALLLAVPGVSAGEPGIEEAVLERSPSREVSPRGRYVSLEETPSDVDLVEAQDAKTLELVLSPQFEDAVERDVIRYRFGLKYGISEHLTVRGDIVLFTGNPVRDEWDNDISNGRLGIKYRFADWPGFAGIRSAVGFDYEFPLGSPPKEIVDGYSRYRSYIVFSRFLERNPRIETFANLSLRFVTDTPFREKPGKERPDHSLRLTVGGIYYTSIMRYTGELGYRTTEIGGGNDNEVFLTPGIIWNIPKESTGFLPGSWQLATGIEIPLTDEDENYRIFARIKWDLDFLRKKVALGE